MLYNNQLLLPAGPAQAADSAASARSGGCQLADQVITAAALFAVVSHAPAAQPAPRARRPQAHGRFGKVANRPAAVLLQRWQKGCWHDSDSH